MAEQLRQGEHTKGSGLGLRDNRQSRGEIMSELSPSKTHHLLVLLGFSTLASILVFFACHFHIIPQIKRLEQQSVLQHINRLRLNLDNELNALTIVAQDYISYTSKGTNLSTKSAHFWQQSFPEALFTLHGLSDVAIYTSEGQLLSGKGRDLSSARFRSIDKSLCTKIINIAVNSSQQSITGLIAGEKSLVMVTAHSLTSLLNRSGPIVILCKPLTDQVIDQGTLLFQSNITIQQLPLSVDDSYSQRAMSHLSERQQVYLQQMTDNRFTTHARLIDLNQQPLGLLQLTLNRSPYFEIERKIVVTLSLLLVSLLLITQQMMGHLKKRIRRPFDLLAKRLQHVCQQDKSITIKPEKGAEKLTSMVNELLTDLTQSRQNQDCSEIETDAIKHVVPCGIFTIDKNELISCWNDRAEQLTGYSANEMIGTPYCRFIQGPCQKQSKSIQSHRFMTSSIDEKHTIYHKNGSQISINLHSEPLCNNDGVDIGRIECFTDITPHKRDKDALIWQLTLNRHLSNLSQTMVEYIDNEAEVAKEVLRQARQLTNSEHGFVATLSPSGKQWLLDYTALFDEFNTSNSTAFIPPAPTGRGSLLHAVYNRKNGVLFNTLQQLNVAHLAGIVDKPFYHFMAVPIWQDNVIIGQIALANNKNGYTARDIQAIDQLAELFAVLLVKKNDNANQDDKQVSQYRLNYKTNNDPYRNK